MPRIRIRNGWAIFNGVRWRVYRLPLGTKRSRIIRIAKWAAAQPGAATSYLYGGVPGIGTGTHTDCSGFVLAVYRRVGLKLARTSQAQYADAPRHPHPAKPGDLLFYNYEGPNSHVGIRIDGATMIADQHTGSGIVRAPIDTGHLDGAASYLT
jgi:cell wall-associated NlpC family hydrolase